MNQKQGELTKREAQTPAGVERTRDKAVFVPPVDIYENGDHIVVVADIPGVSAERLNITLENNVLSIHGSVEPEQYEGLNLAYSEYAVGDYDRSFTISDAVDRDGISATVKDGVLRLTLPKAAKARARSIEVKAA